MKNSASQIRFVFAVAFVLALLFSPIGFAQRPQLFDAYEGYGNKSLSDYQSGNATDNGGSFFGYDFRKYGVLSANPPYIGPQLRPVWPQVNGTSFVACPDYFAIGKNPGGAIGFSASLANAMRVSDGPTLLYCDKAFTYQLPAGQSDPYYKTPGASPEWIAAVRSARQVNPGKPLIWWGQCVYSKIQPSPQWLANSAAYVRGLPFDGVCVMAKGLEEDGQAVGAINYRLLSSQPVSYEQAAATLKPMAGLDLGSLKTNLAVVQMSALADTSHGLKKIDFLDDAGWSGVCQNVANFSRAMREAGLAGFVFDAEDYVNVGTWSYEKVSHPEKSIDVYRDAAARRGRQLMAAVMSEFPSALVMFAGTSPVQSLPANPYYDTGVLQLQLYGSFYAGCAEMITGRF